MAIRTESALDAAVALDHADAVDDFVAVGVFDGVLAVRAFVAEIFATMPEFTLDVLRLAPGQGASARGSP